MKIPKYEAGQVIDLSRGDNDLPDRIYINMVYMKKNSTQWMYEVYSEKNGCVMYVDEKSINTNVSRHNSPVYQKDVVKEMYENGYRFYGNVDKKDLHKKTYGIKLMNNIINIIAIDAYNCNGEVIKDQCGVWIRYKAFIKSGCYDNTIVIK